MYTFCSIWPAGLCSSVTLWASHLTSNTRCSLKPGLLPLLSLNPPAPNSPRVSSPLFSPLCQPLFLSENCASVCVCVGTTGTQPVGKSSTLPGWPSSGRACDSLFSIHKLYCTPPHFFFFYLCSHFLKNQPPDVSPTWLRPGLCCQTRFEKSNTLSQAQKTKTCLYVSSCGSF